MMSKKQRNPDEWKALEGGSAMILSRGSDAKPVFILLAAFLLTALMFMVRMPVHADALSEAQSDMRPSIFPGKDIYEIGDLAHIFIVPSDADYSIEAYDPEGNIAAVSADFPVEKEGEYFVDAIVNVDNESIRINTSFNSVDAAEDAAEESEAIKSAYKDNGSDSDQEIHPAESEKKAPKQDEKNNPGIALGRLKNIGIEFTKDDMHDLIDVKKNSQKNNVIMAKQGVSLVMRGIKRSEIKNITYKEGLLHVDSVDVDSAIISLPHEGLEGITRAPRLYIREDNQSGFSLAQPYTDDGTSYNSVRVTSTHFEFNVEHFTDYYVNSTGGSYSSITDCLDDINGTTGDSCVINEGGSWQLNNSLSFNITPASGQGVIQIAEDDIVLDCNGTELQGDNTSLTYGIYSNGYDNLTVLNCTIYYYEAGMYIRDTANSTFHNNALKGNTAYGIYLRESGYARLFNNTFLENDDYGLYLEDSDYTNITRNIFNSQASLYDDLRITSGLSEQNNIWNNSFYGSGIYDSGSGSDFCVMGEGNFFEQSIPYSGLSLPGPGIPASDCGQSQIIYPSGGSYQNSLFINWTNQSSPLNLTYHIQYSNDSGLTWYFVNSTTSLNNTWDITGIPGGDEYVLRMMPFDGTYNGTINHSARFRIIPDNTWVCSDASLCAYQNLTYALDSVNNTNNTLYLVEENATYTIESAGSYMLSNTTSLYPAIVINATNISVDCSQSEIRGAGSGQAFYISSYDNATIRNCILRNYSTAIYLSDSLYSVVSDNTLQNNTVSIALNRTNQSIISWNDAAGGNIAISLNNSYSCSISNNTINSSTHGLDFFYAGNNTLSQNSLYKTSTGALLHYSDNNSLESNTFMNNTARGAYLLYSDYNRLLNNTVSNNTINGAYLEDSSNNTLRYNLFLDNINYGIFMEGDSDQNNITGNTFRSRYTSYYDLSISPSSAEQNNVWFNSFYSAGVYDRGTATAYCINNSGNFYHEGISYSAIGNGTGESEATIGGDCGPSNLTSPMPGYTYSNAITIRWTEQSSINDVDYTLHYSDDNGTSWNLLADAAQTYYIWDVSSLQKGSEYLVKVTPYDGSHNATVDEVNGSFSLNSAPNISQVMLNATSALNLTSDNLTAYPNTTSDPDGDSVKLNYNWYRNGLSDTLINMPFTVQDAENKTYDFSGNENHGTVHGAVFNETAGYDGSGAFEFDGVDDMILVQESPNLNISNRPFTIEAWVYRKGDGTPAGSSGTYVIAGKAASNLSFSSLGYGLAQYNPSYPGKSEELYFAVGSGPNFYSAEGIAPADNTWYHVVGVWNTTDILIYINGSLEGNASAPGPLNTLDLNFSIGAFQYDDPTYNRSAWNGTIDELRVYNRSLSAEEISLLFSNRTNITHSSATLRGDNWTVKATPIDEHGMNGSSAESNSILITLNNTYVCSDTNLCKYHNLTEALDSENGTGRTIYLIEDHVTYIISRTGLYNISPSAAYSIVINATNITLDCNGTELRGSGSGSGVYTEYNNATVANCILRNYTKGMDIINSLYGTYRMNQLLNNTFGIITNNTNHSTIINNTLDNHSIGILMNMSHSNIIRNNTVMNSSDISIYLENGSRNDLRYNIIRYSTDYGIYIAGYSDHDNITRNIFAGSGLYDLYVNSTNSTVILNSFYSRGVNITDSINAVFCAGDEGNFYEHDIPHSLIGNGTGLNGTNIGGDCGPSILTYPQGGESFINKSDPIKINWTSQSSINNISYDLLYSSDNGTSWNLLNTTANLEYNWSISSFGYGDEYRLKVVPFDDYYNATNTSSSAFSMGIDNNWVCSNETLCEYQDITSALIGENNTAGNITIQESGIYAASGSSGFNITSIGSDFGYAIRINASDVVLDCNGSSLSSESFSDSYAIWISRNVSTISNITVRNCSLSYYEAGIAAYNANNITIAGNTITGNLSGSSGSNAGVLLENVNGSSMIENNVMSSFTTWGIRTLYSHDTIIYSNNISNCSSAISASTTYSTGLNITNNWINDTQNIILANDTLFKGNTILNNAACSSGVLYASSLSNINITENTILAQTGVDCNASVYSASGTGINIWLNNFYSKGVNATDSETNFCVNGMGNFYGQNIPVSAIGNGTGESGTTIGGDCGPANITYPVPGGSYKSSITINWTNQSSINNVSYHIYYSADSGTTWNYISSSESAYLWDVSAMMGNGFRLNIVPYDDYYNATNYTMSSSFNIIPNNQYVCSNLSYCEYGNLTDALLGEDDSNNTIYLIEPNITHTIHNSSFNISPSGLYPAMHVNASNVTIDCNGSAISDSGTGIGIYSAFSNTTIINCNISNYQYGIVLESSLNNTIANSTIFNNSIAGVLLNSTNLTDITGNTFNNTNATDLYINGTNNTVWLNNFYGGGVNETSNNSYCDSSLGNYYSPSVNSTNIMSSSCGLLSQAYEDKDSDGYYTLSDCNDNNAGIRPGAAESCDGVDNDCDGTIDEGCVTLDDEDESGGGSSRGGPALTIKRYELTDNITISMKTDEIIILEIGSELYRMKLNKVYFDRVQITAPPDSNMHEISVNETEAVDLDNDTIDDITVRLDEIPNGKATLMIALYGAEQPSVQETEDVLEEQPAAEDLDDITGEDVLEPETRPPRPEEPRALSKRPQDTSILPYLIAGILAVVLLGGGAAGALYYMGSKAAEQNISKLQPYIDHEHSLGIDHDVIKRKLIELGWAEDTVEKALSNAKNMSKIDDAKNYIKESISSGKSRDEVRKTLLDSGWSKRDADILMRSK
ncbi:hypothetical protein GF345_06615 [Candidatus Woesearchaeota archaeon]|nr:hypothetical protein [Candidatus Woesearchaeota archaeon]